MFGKRELTDDFEDQLLEVANSHDGRVTVAVAAAETTLSLADAESILPRLAKDGHLRMDIDGDGDNAYAFPGLDDSETTFDEAQSRRNSPR